MSFTFDPPKISFPDPPKVFGIAPSVKSEDEIIDWDSGEVTSVLATPASNSQRSGTTTPAQDSEKPLPNNFKATKSTQKTIPIDKNVFYNEETLKYMRIIDMYKKLGIGKDIELPRLVIAGAQSCGKSSLLENLTGLPVPITSGIGTRFPIEITLIEDPKKFQIKPSIVLDPKIPRLSSKDMEKMRKFNLGQVYNEAMSQEQFEDVLRETSSLFSVPPPVFARDHISPINSLGNYPTQISSHTLQIEMRGPDFKSLSFVDTPGLYAAATSDQNAKSVVDIEKLVVSLIEEKRTVIVAVMEATQGTETQKIFKFADDVDITGERTLGVLTKCDLVKTSETDAFQATISTATNMKRVIHHGWYVVKNRSSTETKQDVSLEAARLRETALFAEKEWSPISSGIQKDRMGIAALRTGLSSVFCAHIRAEFPAFNQQTRRILAQRRAQLEKLGPARSTVAEQRQYLYSIVKAYQKPKLQCLNDDLRPEPFFTGFGSEPVLLDRRLAFQKKHMLRDALKNNGAVWAFRTPTADRDELSDEAARALLDTENKVIYTWINTRYQNTKSCSIPGIVPYSLIERLFEEQTAKWASVTDGFVDGVQEVFVSAVTSCLSKACHNSLVLAPLTKMVLHDVRYQMEKFRSFCHNLIRNEQNGLQVVASEEQFVGDIREARTLRFISAISKLETETFFWKGFDLKANSVTAQDTAKPTTGGPFAEGASTDPEMNVSTLISFMKANKYKIKDVLTDDCQIVYEIHDILHAYYKTSLQHYTDSICKDGLNKGFVEQVMDVFSDAFVETRLDREVKEIAAESAADRKTRRELMEDIERLEKAIAESEAILKEPLGS